MHLDAYPFLLQHLLLPTLGVFTHYKVTGQLRQQLSVETMSLVELGRLQQQRLTSIVKHASETVPFYHDRFLEVGFSPANLSREFPLDGLPPTTKEDIMLNFPDRVTPRQADRRHWKYVATTGTNRQVIGVHDLRKTNSNRAARLRCQKLACGNAIGKRWMEIPPRMCSDRCGTGTREQPSLISKELWRHFGRMDVGGVSRQIQDYVYSKRQTFWRRLTLPAFANQGTNMSDRQIEESLRVIERFRPYMLEALPTYLHVLAKFVLARAYSIPRIPVVSPFGGSMTPRMRTTISKAFGCQVRDKYGCAELGDIGCECDRQEGVHYFMDLFYVEFCRKERPVQPGRLGKLYITDLENRALPFIRYEIGDVGRYFIDDHGCGRSSIRFQVEGRVDDTIVNSSGTAFSSDQVFDFFDGQDEIDSFQLIEVSKGDFELLCVPQHGHIVSEESIVNRFRAFFDPFVNVKVFIVKTIKPEDGGKFRFVKSRSFDVL